MKKILSIVLAVALVTVMFTGTCFASDGYRDDYGVVGDNQFAATLSLNAKTLSIKLYDGVTFERYTNGGKPATTIRGVIYIINASGYPLNVTNVHYEDADSGWEMVAKDSDFASMAVETKKYSLYIGDVDFLTDDYTEKVTLTQDQYSPSSIEIWGNTAKTILANNDTLGTFTVTISLDQGEETD